MKLYARAKDIRIVVYFILKIMSTNDADDGNSEIQSDIEKPQPKRKVKSKESRKQSVFAGRIIEVREKKGVLQAAIPTVPTWFAWICLLVNVLLPGIGK